MKTQRTKRALPIRLVAVPAALAALIGCAPTSVQPVQTYGGAKLPRPDVVVVNDFAGTAQQVKLDSGVRGRLLGVLSGSSTEVQQSEAERKVTAEISKVLVEEIKKLGLPAVRSTEPVVPPAANKLVIHGHIVSIDEGNQTRRNVIGFGAGQSTVRAVTDVYYDSPSPSSRMVESFTSTAESPRKPGAAETMGMGAVTGRVAESAAVGAGTGLAMSGDVESDGGRMAKAIAEQLGRLFAAQGWTAPK